MSNKAPSRRETDIKEVEKPAPSSRGYAFGEYILIFDHRSFRKVQDGQTCHPKHHKRQHVNSRPEQRNVEGYHGNYVRICQIIYPEKGLTLPTAAFLPVH